MAAGAFGDPFAWPKDDVVIPGVSKIMAINVHFKGILLFIMTVT